MQSQICELRDKLNKSILTEDYEVTYELSIQLDDLITEYYGINKDESVQDIISRLTDEMLKHAQSMEFEKAAELRDKIKELERIILFDL